MKENISRSAETESEEDDDDSSEGSNKKTTKIPRRVPLGVSLNGAEGNGRVKTEPRSFSESLLLSMKKKKEGAPEVAQPGSNESPARAEKDKDEADLVETAEKTDSEVETETTTGLGIKEETEEDAQWPDEGELDDGGEIPLSTARLTVAKSKTDSKKVSSEETSGPEDSTDQPEEEPKTETPAETEQDTTAAETEARGGGGGEEPPEPPGGGPEAAPEPPDDEPPLTATTPRPPVTTIPFAERERAYDSSAEDARRHQRELDEAEYQGRAYGQRRGVGAGLVAGLLIGHHGKKKAVKKQAKKFDKQLKEKDKEISELEFHQTAAQKRVEALEGNINAIKQHVATKNEAAPELPHERPMREPSRPAAAELHGQPKPARENTERVSKEKLTSNFSEQLLSRFVSSRETQIGAKAAEKEGKFLSVWEKQALKDREKLFEGKTKELALEDQEITEDAYLAPEGRRVESSSWHRIEVDEKTGRAVENPEVAYGEEFKRETKRELLKDLHADPVVAALHAGVSAIKLAQDASYSSGQSSSVKDTVSHSQANNPALGVPVSAQSHPQGQTKEVPTLVVWLTIAFFVVVLAAIALTW